MQNVAAQKHSGAFLQLEKNDLFRIPLWILSYAPGRFQPTLIQAENLNPNLQHNKSHLYQSRAALPGDSAACKALWWLQVPFLLGRIPQRYLLSLNSFTASPAKIFKCCFARIK